MRKRTAKESCLTRQQKSRLVKVLTVVKTSTQSFAEPLQKNPVTQREARQQILSLHASAAGAAAFF